jgi:hypothetical protein
MFTHFKSLKTTNLFYLLGDIYLETADRIPFLLNIYDLALLLLLLMLLVK